MIRESGAGWWTPPNTTVKRMPRRSGLLKKGKWAMQPGPRLAVLKRELAQAAQGNPAGYLAWFKTGKGEYGAGDRFIGVRVPVQRAIAGKYHHLGLDEIEKLLESRIHEHRFTGLLILVAQYQGGNESTKRRVFSFYLDHTRCVDNWDLVDASAPAILGEHLVFRSRRVLYRLAGSLAWWERRIAMVATAAFIDRGDLKDTFDLAALLLTDTHDLIHKAIGWMLREAGRHSRTQLLDFLKRHYGQLPRTTLRYAIEHLPEPRRKKALTGKFS
jgi:3-methyladenine DNA glycosylase AlkD